LRNIIEQCHEWQRGLYINFIDLRKAFDSNNSIVLLSDCFHKIQKKPDRLERFTSAGRASGQPHQNGSFACKHLRTVAHKNWTVTCTPQDDPAIHLSG